MEDNEEGELNEDNLKNLISLKILILGDSLVGKTSLMLKYVDYVFPAEHMATIGVEYKHKIIKKDDYNIKLQIWDTSGQERFHSITKNIYRNTNGVLFVYDITNKQTFNSIKNWIKDTENIDKDIKGVIVGNKVDLEKGRVIDKESLEELGNKRKMPFLETSAKENINVNEAFNLLIDELLKDKSEKEIMECFKSKNRSDLSISTKRTENPKKRRCC